MRPTTVELIKRRMTVACGDGAGVTATGAI